MGLVPMSSPPNLLARKGEKETARVFGFFYREAIWMARLYKWQALWLMRNQGYQFTRILLKDLWVLSLTFMLGCSL